MRYDLDEVREYDDYDVEGELEEDYGSCEEYEEEEEAVGERQPTQEELEYLELRQRLKESIRRKKMKENASALSNAKEKQKQFSKDNYGSFFGPAQPIIAQRVIQESKSLLENQHLVAKLLNSSHSNSNVEKSSVSNGQGMKHAVNNKKHRGISELKSKVEKLKVARDYSFLSDDTELPVPRKESVPHSAPRPNYEGRPAQMALKSRQQSVSSSGRNGQMERPAVSATTKDGRSGQIVLEDGRPVSSNGQMRSSNGQIRSSNGQMRSSNGQMRSSNGQMGSSNGQMRSKVLPNKASAERQNLTTIDSKKQLAAGRSNLAAVDPRKQLIARNGAGTGRPVASKVPPSKMPSRMVERKSSTPMVRNLNLNMQRAPPAKMPAVDSRQRLELKKRPVPASKDKVALRQPAASVRPQNKSLMQVSSHASQLNRPRKRRHFEDGLDDPDEALNEIRKMFNTKRYANINDDDDLSDMEANFDEIMMEERMSAKIARQEDDEQERLIAEEERRERARKAKKRKLGH